jgi:hypothetical protein
LFFRALQRLAIIVFMSSVNPRKCQGELTNAERGEAIREKGSEYCATVEAPLVAPILVQRSGRKYPFGVRSHDLSIVT